MHSKSNTDGDVNPKMFALGKKATPESIKSNGQVNKSDNGTSKLLKQSTLKMNTSSPHHSDENL
jgi:hypothetical protein